MKKDNVYARTPVIELALAMSISCMIIYVLGVGSEEQMFYYWSGCMSGIYVMWQKYK